MMPVIRDMPLSLKLNHILRRQGIRGRSSRPKMVAITQELLTIVEELHLVEPVVAHQTYSVSEVSHDRLSLTNGTVISGTLLPSLLSKSKDLAVVVCTIGPRVEDKVTGYLEKNEPLRGLLLDGIGTAAIDTLTVEACKSIRQKAVSCGYQASSPLSPGMPGFALSEQWTLLQLATAEQIGVSLTSSGVMVPRKSTSVVIGMGSDMPTWTPEEVCAGCCLKEICLYRIQG